MRGGQIGGQYGRQIVGQYDSCLTKVHVVKTMVFLEVIYGCESWAIMKAEHQRIDAFKLVLKKDTWESLELQGDQTSPF